MLGAVLLRHRTQRALSIYSSFWLSSPPVREIRQITPVCGICTSGASSGFVNFVAGSLRQMGPAAPAAADYRKHLDAQPGKSALLAELRRDPLVVTLLQGTRVPSPRASVFADEKPPQYILSTTSLLLVRGKALNLSVYGPYDSPADLDWLRAITARWIEDLQRLNSR